MLIVQEDGTPKHIMPVPYVERVPNKRQVEASFAGIVSSLTLEQCKKLADEIETVKDFICSR